MSSMNLEAWYEEEGEDPPAFNIPVGDICQCGSGEHGLIIMQQKVLSKTRMKLYLECMKCNDEYQITISGLTA